MSCCVMLSWVGLGWVNLWEALCSLLVVDRFGQASVAVPSGKEADALLVFGGFGPAPSAHGRLGDLIKLTLSGTPHQWCSHSSNNSSGCGGEGGTLLASFPHYSDCVRVPQLGTRLPSVHLVSCSQCWCYLNECCLLRCRGGGAW